MLIGYARVSTQDQNLELQHSTSDLFDLLILVYL